MSNLAGNPSIPVLQAGNIQLVDISGLICLGALVVAQGVGGRYSTLRNAFATSGYQVTAGKTFRILLARMVVRGATVGAGSANGWGYGDTDVGLTSAAAPTNAVANNNMIPGPDRTTSGSVYFVSGKADVPAQKYVYVLADGADQWFTVWGYEF